MPCRFDHASNADEHAAQASFVPGQLFSQFTNTEAKQSMGTIGRRPLVTSVLSQKQARDQVIRVQCEVLAGYLGSMDKMHRSSAI